MDIVKNVTQQCTDMEVVQALKMVQNQTIQKKNQILLIVQLHQTMDV